MLGVKLTSRKCTPVVDHIDLSRPSLVKLSFKTTRRHVRVPYSPGYPLFFPGSPWGIDE